MAFKSTWLVQRLTQSFMLETIEPKGVWKLIKDGKVSEESMKLRAQIHSYDYMGSAEFEYGAIPEVVKSLIVSKLIAFSFDTKVTWQLYNADCGTMTREHTIYVLCRDGQEEDVEKRIKELVSDKERDFNLKESMRLGNGFEKQKDGKPSRLVGWLEIDNGFYFFSDKKTWQCMTKLYTGKLPP
jgi:hypothetical protein